MGEVIPLRKSAEPHVKCPQCGSVWWNTAVTIDRLTGRVDAHSLSHAVCRTCRAPMPKDLRTL